MFQQRVEDRVYCRSLRAQALFTVLPSLADLCVALSPEEWGCMVRACRKGLRSAKQAVKLATSVISAGAVYGRLDDPQVVGFIEAYGGLVEQSAAAMQAARNHKPLRRACAQVRAALYADAWSMSCVV
jgi:hypothetical protein